MSEPTTFDYELAKRYVNNIVAHNQELARDLRHAQEDLADLREQLARAERERDAARKDAESAHNRAQHWKSVSAAQLAEAKRERDDAKEEAAALLRRANWLETQLRDVESALVEVREEKTRMQGFLLSAYEKRVQEAKREWAKELEYWVLDRMKELGPQPNITQSDSARYAWAGKMTAYEVVWAHVTGADVDYAPSPAAAPDGDSSGVFAKHGDSYYCAKCKCGGSSFTGCALSECEAVGFNHHAAAPTREAEREVLLTTTTHRTGLVAIVTPADAAAIQRLAQRGEGV